ncbi:MAG: 1-acyl-sn-glycerol-3-phosphate acyltransferase, partial [Chloroflexi bacterium]|nr:1-acyl-sn-glycerol-3-phosphate acyltransferase [Chloroflexota bacterium]
MFRRIADFVLRILFHLVFKIEISGLDNVPKLGPFIAMMNHIYFLDPVLVSALAPRLIIIMSKIENYRNPLFALIMRLYGTFPVRRGELDMSAIRTSLQVLKEGHGLLMAPEGTRSRTHTLQEGRDGMAWLALRTNAPIVPVALSGQERMGYYLRRLRRTPLRVVFGEPFRFRPIEGAQRHALLHRMTQEAMYRLAALLPPSYRGVYS